jgi:uncharacterized protein YcbK (DUF882 family)
MATRKRLSAHFVIEEFDCHDGTKVPASAIPALQELCEHILEPLRAKYGPCKVLSGYRHRSYNRSIGGARFSQHIYDDTPGSVAIDFTFRRGTPNDWARSAKWRFVTKWRWRKAKRGGVGTYPASVFVHVDSGPRRDWKG